MNARAHGMTAFDAPSLRSSVSRVRSTEEISFGDSLLSVLLGLYITTLLFEGVLRYVFATAGFPNALYVRDVIPVVSVLFLFLRALLADRRIELPIAIALVLLACHAAWAMVLGVNNFAIAFGLKIFMFIPYGMAMWPLVRRRWRFALTFAAAMFAVTAAGVFANFFLQKMPWEGLEYQTAFGSVTSTRLWWVPGGFSRLPGFARTSFDAAMILGITGMLALLRFRHLAVRLSIIALGLVAIVLTTSKGMILAFPVAASWLIAADRWPWMKGRVLVTTLCAVTAVLPLLMVGYNLSTSMHASNFPAAINSVWERFSMVWPQAFDLLPDGPAALLGAGPGSIGTPQLYGAAPHHFNPADNLAIFLVVNFGLLGLGYYALPAWILPKVADFESTEIHRAYVGMLVIAYGYGMSISMIEESFFCLFFGLSLGIAAGAWLQKESP